MPSKPVFSDADKKAIRMRLGELCEECWIAHGYKKTSIKNLCDKAGISIGTFYTLYPTKEDLFSETIELIQKKLTEKVLDINRRRQTKLPKDTMQKIKFDSFEAFRQAAQAANLTLKMEPSQAYGILSALLTTVNAKETLSATCDYFAVFDCMTDILVNSIFE